MVECTPLFHSSSIPNQTLYSIKGGERERLKLQLLKENNRPFDRTKREGEGGSLDPSIPVSCGQGKSFQFLTGAITFHRQKDSSLLQERKAEQEEGVEIGEGSCDRPIEPTSKALQDLPILNSAVDRLDPFELQRPDDMALEVDFFTNRIDRSDLQRGLDHF